MITKKLRVASLLAAVVFAGLLGCREETPPPVAVEPVAAAPTSDEMVLRALDYYDPMYKVDANGRVTHLRLSGRHLPIAVLAEVGKLTELRGLDLWGTTVDDEGVAHFKDLQKLTNLGLGASMITDKGLAHLEKLQSLQWLWVPPRTKPGIDKLKEARPDMNVYLQ